MQVVIIDREPFAAEQLQDILDSLDPGIRVVKQLFTVAEATAYFDKNGAPDLIFSDIELADGTSFHIFEKTAISAPIVFITTGTQYALQAFKTNGIDYILKPLNKNSISEAIHKYVLIQTAIFKKLAYDQSHITGPGSAKNKTELPTRLLVKYCDRITPVQITNIAFFECRNKTLQLTTMENRSYPLSKTLEETEKICGGKFYRVNRQLLLNREAIREVLQGYSRKLVVKLKTSALPDIVIHKAKATEFLTWLSA
ncbi:LytR/AlgR family response regulator transcription factor [Niabella beijingensis]|uniref:LytR/AlgR family response regulator transcription factor n=1 Tax=Niabella beijingensis TaxID=2872700 RepID=UPI001CC0BE22|nr:LytTR family DNA-binding domain-containing protein [Niabella beijingensis]MBZ4192563.1 LytTR family DNA-binding domain-containing protein [Niabella beijingensis]